MGFVRIHFDFINLILFLMINSTRPIPDYESKNYTFFLFYLCNIIIYFLTTKPTWIIIHFKTLSEMKSSAQKFYKGFFKQFLTLQVGPACLPKGPFRGSSISFYKKSNTFCLYNLYKGSEQRLCKSFSAYKINFKFIARAYFILLIKSN